MIKLKNLGFGSRNKYFNRCHHLSDSEILLRFLNLQTPQYNLNPKRESVLYILVPSPTAITGATGMRTDGIAMLIVLLLLPI